MSTQSTAPIMTEKHDRLHERLLDYWNTLRGSRTFPMESEIDPDSLRDIWRSCFLISIDDVTRRLGYRYSYLGEDLIEAYGDDDKNPDVALRLLSTANTPIIKKYDEVVHAQKPLFDESSFVNLKHLKIKYRTCMLPLGTPDGTVTHILGSMRWRIY